MLLSLCALGCYGAWVWAPDWVRAVDTKLILFYTQSGEDRFTACANKIHRDRAAGIAELNELVEEWTGYRYGDRRLRLAQKALQHLVRVHASAEDYSTAVETLERHLDLMGGDIHTRSRLYVYMAKVAGRRAEAIAGLQRAHQEFPMHHRFCAPLANLLAEDGRISEGWDVHATTLERSQSNIWGLMWEQPKRKNRNMYVRLVPRATKGGFVISAELPLQVTNLHVQPSINAYSEYQELTARLEWPQGSIEVPIRAAALDGITLIDGVYRITSERPAIHFRKLLNVRAAVQIPNHVRMKLTINGVGGPVPSPEMANYAWLHQDALRAIATERGDAAMSKLIETASQGAFLGLNSKFYWCGKGTDFSAKRMLQANLVTQRSGDDTTYTVEFELDATANRVRFDFPEITSTSWKITTFELRTDAGVIQLGDQAPNATPGLELVDDLYRVTNSDPYLVYNLDEEIKIKGVRVTGTVQ